MFALGKSSPKHPIYFDIRVRSLYKDVILIPGSPLETSPTSLNGHLVFSLPEDISVKAISLRLVGRFKLEFLQVGTHKCNKLVSHVKEEIVVFQCVWDNLLTACEGVVVDQNGARPGSGESSRWGISEIIPLRPTFSNPTMSSRRNITIDSRRLIRSTSSTVLTLPLYGISGTPYCNHDAAMQPGASFLLPKGNYELPFHVLLPADIPETVEGLQSGSMLYRFESTLERGGFKNDFSTHKYLRIFRTLSPDNLALQEEASVSNQKANRIQYEVLFPSRGIPIGATTPLQIKIYPFRKGYRLQQINISLIQQYAVQDTSGHTYNDEFVVAKESVTDFSGLAGCNSIDGNLLYDAVDLHTTFKIPNHLKQVTQHCDSGGSLIRVRHRIQVHIIIKNSSFPSLANDKSEDRNTEIRATIPVLLYIAKNVPIKGRMIVIDNAGKFHIRPGVTTDLFDNQSPSYHSSNYNFPSAVMSCEQFDAPPSYESRIYDQLFTDSLDNIPISSQPGNHSNSISWTLSSSPTTSPSTIASGSGHLPLQDLNQVPAYNSRHDAEDVLPIHHMSPLYDANSLHHSPPNS